MLGLLRYDSLGWGPILPWALSITERVAGYVNRWRSQRHSGGALFGGIEVDDKIGRVSVIPGHNKSW